MDERMASLAAEPGLISDGQNAWYTPDLINCYYNGWFTTAAGVTYHFDNSGLADYGWKLIGGQGCYFDEQAVYQPDADPNKLLAFTFDDGPSQGMDEILSLCEETGSRATFFMIGTQVQNGGAVIPHIIQDRCQVGNHSMTHTQMTTVSAEECSENFRQCDEWIRSFSGGIESDVIRYPYGDYTSDEPAAVGKPGIMWSVDSLDWDLRDTQLIIDQVLKQTTEGDIILMHDRYEETVEACRYLFPYFIEQGYQLVTVKELAAAKGYELEAGKTYYGFCQEYIEDGRVYQ
ncbi:MAG: polysaccharide deacetylase family protein [Lachnospiraceae bacterium]|nr:polysaccharide deacetylase family protein [Lachnospiraceae bacterium]